MVGRRSVRIVEMFVLAITWGIATAAAITTAFEALTTAATTRKTTAAASDDTCHDAENYETADNNDSNYWPLAPGEAHTIVPT